MTYFSLHHSLFKICTERCKPNILLINEKHAFKMNAFSKAYFICKKCKHGHLNFHCLYEKGVLIKFNKYYAYKGKRYHFLQNNYSPVDFYLFLY